MTPKPVTKKRDPNQLSRQICSYFRLACVEPTLKPTIATPIVKIYCSEYQELGYSCIPFYQCGIQTKELLIDVINLRNSDTEPYHDDIVHSKCLENQEVCCLPPTNKNRFK